MSYLVYLGNIPLQKSLNVLLFLTNSSKCMVFHFIIIFSFTQVYSKLYCRHLIYWICIPLSVFCWCEKWKVMVDLIQYPRIQHFDFESVHIIIVSNISTLRHTLPTIPTAISFMGHKKHFLESNYCGIKK